MNTLFASEQPSHSQLVSQLRKKNKQIQFLEDKMLLIQREKQTKVAELSNKYSHLFDEHNRASSLVEQTNADLKTKLTKAKQRIIQLSETHTELTNQLKHLAEMNSSLNKQTKSLKSKYQRQRHQTSLLQQQSVHLKSIISILQKQLRELTKKNLELIQQKKILITTYNDYDEVKWKLGEIHGVYQQQYEQEVRLVKEKMRHEMLTSLVCTQEDCLKPSGKSQTEMMITNDQKMQNQSNLTVSNHKTCQNCLLETSWSQDLIRLSNLVSYGPEYLLSVATNPENPVSHPAFSLQQNQGDAPNRYDQETYEKPAFINSKTDHIFSFITQVLHENRKIHSQLKQNRQNTDKVKSQLQQKINQLLEQVNTLEEEQKKSALQSRQSLEQLQFTMNQINQRKITSNESLSQMVTQNNNLKLQAQSSQFVMNALLVLCSKVIGKFSEFQARAEISAKADCIKKKNKRAKNKLKTIMLTVFFVEVLKKSSQRLRRKARLHFGIKLPGSKKSNQNQLTLTSNSLEYHSLSISSVIFGPQNLFRPLYFQNLSSSYQANLLKRCVYEIKREEILAGKKKSQSNHFLSEIIDQITKTKLTEQWLFVYRSLIHGIQQHNFQNYCY